MTDKRNPEVAWTYHNATKHSYTSIRTNPHFMDWSNQPLPFKIYPTLEPLRLPAEVRQTGVTRTLLGRERPIPDINSRNPNSRGFAERTAVNSPLQGTAADLIKLAMIRIDRALTAGGYQSALLLQVHDELLLESPPEELPEVTRIVLRSPRSLS